MSYRISRLLMIIPLLIPGMVGCQSVENLPTWENSSQIQTSQNNDSSTLVDPSFLSAIEQVTYRDINKYRLSRNLSPLQLNPQISQQARIHSERMAAGIIPVGHDKLEERLKIISISLPLEKGVENLIVHKNGDDPVKETLKQWLKNPQNRQNIEGNYDETGIGVAQNRAGNYYFTQIFIKRINSPLGGEPEINSSFDPLKNRDLLLEKASQDGRLLIALEEEINQRVNQYRLSKNLPPLQMNAQMSYVARQYSEKMANKTATFSHNGFEGRAATIGKTIPYQTFAENLAYLKGYADLAPVAVKGWINSPGHRKTMEGNFNLTGVGIAKNSQGEYYFTQLFLLQR